MAGRARRALKWIAIAVAAAVIALLLAGIALHEPRPAAREGAEADALAQKIEEAVGLEAWERTGAVRWDHAGRTEHLWDRARGLARVRWDDVEVLYRIGTRRGRAWEDGREARGARRAALIDEADARWTNDAFWLNPLAKMRDPGVHRGVVPLEGGGRGLLVWYTTGGRTPGDAYLWITGDDGLPVAWKMWVSILPIGGVRTSWERWITLSTGAKVSTLHRAGPIAFELTGVRGAADVVSLEGEDPFAALTAR